MVAFIWFLSLLLPVWHLCPLHHPQPPTSEFHRRPLPLPLALSQFSIVAPPGSQSGREVFSGLLASLK